MNAVLETIKHLDKAYKFNPMSYYFRGEEGSAFIGHDDWRRWEFFGDRFLAISLKNGKIIHLSFPSEDEREHQMQCALEWWSK